jgi:hypothetical protein
MVLYLENYRNSQICSKLRPGQRTEPTKANVFRFRHPEEQRIALAEEASASRDPAVALDRIYALATRS